MGRGKKWTWGARKDLAKAFVITCRTLGPPENDNPDSPFWQAAAAEFYQSDPTGSLEYKSRTPRIMQHTHKNQYTECKQFTRTAMRKVIDACPETASENEMLSMAIAVHLSMVTDINYEFRNLEHTQWVSSGAWKVYSKAATASLSGLEDLAELICAGDPGHAIAASGPSVHEAAVPSPAVVVPPVALTTSPITAVRAADVASAVAAAAAGNVQVGGGIVAGRQAGVTLDDDARASKRAAASAGGGVLKRLRRPEDVGDGGSAAALVRIARALEAGVAAEEAKLGMQAFEEQNLDEEGRAQKMEFMKHMRRRALDSARATTTRVDLPVNDANLGSSDGSSAANPVLEIKLVR